MKKIYLIISLLASSIVLSLAQTVSFTGTPYTQDFNSLPSSGAVTVTGLGPFEISGAPVNASGMQGWYFGLAGGSATFAGFRIDNGSATSGSVYSYGATSNTNRALGSLASGSQTPRFGLMMTNNSGNTLNTFTVTYTGQQWRNGGNAIKNFLRFDYVINATSLADANFISVSGLSFNSISTGGTGAALDGYNSVNQALVIFTVSGISWPNNQNLLLRWTDRDETGSDDGLAIDDFYFNAFNYVAPPVLSISPSTLVNLASINQNSTVTSTSISLSGSNFLDNLTISGNSSNLMFSLNNGSATSSLEIPSTAGNLGASLAFIYTSGTTSGAFTEVVKLSSTNLADVFITVTGVVLGGAPSLIISTNPFSFGNVAAGSFDTRAFTVVGFNLSGNITATGLSGAFDIANDINGPFSTVLELMPNSISGHVVSYVRFSPTAVTTYASVITFETPGAILPLSVSGTGTSFSGSGRVVAFNPESLGTQAGTSFLATNLNIWRRGTTNKTIGFTVTNTTGNITKVRIQLPPAFSFTTVSLVGSAFQGATTTRVASAITVTGANVNATSTGVLLITDASIPNPSGSNFGAYSPQVATADDFGTFTNIAQNPKLYVTVPISNFRQTVDVATGLLPTTGSPRAGDTLVVEGNAIVGTGRLSTGNFQFYMQDATGGLSVFRSGTPLIGTIMTGTGLILRGGANDFSGLNQINPGPGTLTSNVILTGNNQIPTPTVVTITDLMLNPETYEGSLISIINATTSVGTTISGWPSTITGSGFTTSITDDGSVSRTNLRLTNVPATGFVFNGLTPLFPMTVTGMFAQFTGSGNPDAAKNPLGYQLIPRGAYDITFASGVVTSLQDNATSGWIVYPNPMVENKVNVVSDLGAKMTVLNSQGLEVAVPTRNLSAKESQLDFSSLANGLYVIVISSESKSLRTKVIK